MIRAIKRFFSGIINPFKQAYHFVMHKTVRHLKINSFGKKASRPTLWESCRTQTMATRVLCHSGVQKLLKEPALAKKFTLDTILDMAESGEAKTFSARRKSLSTLLNRNAQHAILEGHIPPRHYDKLTQARVAAVLNEDVQALMDAGIVCHDDIFSMDDASCEALCSPAGRVLLTGPNRLSIADFKAVHANPAAHIALMDPKLWYEKKPNDVLTGLVSVEILKNRPQHVEKALRNRSIRRLIKNGYISMERFFELQSGAMSALKKPYIRSLIRKGELNPGELNDLTPGAIKALNNRPIRRLFTEKRVSISELNDEQTRRNLYTRKGRQEKSRAPIAHTGNSEQLNKLEMAVQFYHKSKNLDRFKLKDLKENALAILEGYPSENKTSLVAKRVFSIDQLAKLSEEALDALAQSHVYELFADSNLPLDTTDLQRRAALRSDQYCQLKEHHYSALQKKPTLTNLLIHHWISFDEFKELNQTQLKHLSDADIASHVKMGHLTLNEIKESTDINTLKTSASTKTKQNHEEEKQEFIEGHEALIGTTLAPKQVKELSIDQITTLENQKTQTQIAYRSGFALGLEEASPTNHELENTLLNTHKQDLNQKNLKEYLETFKDREMGPTGRFKIHSDRGNLAVKTRLQQACQTPGSAKGRLSSAELLTLLIIKIRSYRTEVGKDLFNYFTLACYHAKKERTPWRRTVCDFLKKPFDNADAKRASTLITSQTQ